MTKPTFYLIELTGLAIQRQLEMEEALFRASDKNFCVINAKAPPAIVLGLSCQVEEHVNLKKIYTSPLPIIKRFSGGGSVVVDPQTLFVSFIANANEIKINPFPKDLLQWTKKIYCPLIPGFHIQENDYVIGKKKIGGNAQSLAKKRFCHHSTLLWDWEKEMMDYLNLPKKMPNYRQKREHHNFLDKIKNYIPCDQMFKQQLIDQLQKHFQVVTLNKDNLNHLLEEIMDKKYRQSVVDLSSSVLNNHR